MELLLYFVNGILYSFLAMFAIFFVIVGIYGVFRVMFWIFETLGIENPFVVIYDYLTSNK